jgi:hypothetical protein
VHSFLVLRRRARPPAALPTTHSPVLGLRRDDPQSRRHRPTRPSRAVIFDTIPYYHATRGSQSVGFHSTSRPPIPLHFISALLSPLTSVAARGYVTEVVMDDTTLLRQRPRREALS